MNANWCIGNRGSYFSEAETYPGVAFVCFFVCVCVGFLTPIVQASFIIGSTPGFTQIFVAKVQAVFHQGSPLPRAVFVNDVGYLPDGTPMNKAGNAINHPEAWFEGRGDRSQDHN